MKRALKLQAHNLAGILAALLLVACANPTVRAERIADAGGLTVSVMQGADFRHQIFHASRGETDPLYVFVESDGSPWVDGGTRIAEDPTPRRPLALELAARTPGSVLYLGRPCYYSVHGDDGCTSDVWTSARYSSRVVDSMVAVLNRYVAAGGFSRAVLIGYSGGGTLAMLMTPRVPAVTAVITIAGNLDIEAWTRWHQYLPLDGSLNPATQEPLPESIEQRHLAGGRDTNVPLAVNARFLISVPPDRVWIYANFDHVCCWVEQWPTILARIEGELNLPSAGRKSRSESLPPVNDRKSASR
jgi:hypothetical protein